jgi:superfamily II DNA or RNA helicase
MPQLGFQFDSLREEIQAIGGIVPRDYQHLAIENAFRLWHEGVVGVLVRQPTGSGKTITGAMMARKWLDQGNDYRVLVLCHERQLVHQFASEIQDVLGEYPGVEMADEKVKRGIPPITVASRQTLNSKIDDSTRRLDKFNPFKYKWLIELDEVHRYAYKLPSCRPILEWFDASPANRRLGLTATPERTDKTTLAKVCPGVASDYRLYDIDGGSCAVSDGWAVAYDQRFVLAEGVDFKNLRELKGTGDFDPAELETILGEESMLRKLVEPTLELVGGRRTIIFSATTGMAKAVARCINSFRPDSAVELDGHHGEWHRADVYRRHQSGAFQFLSVCGLCREGYNDPGIQAVAIFRPTKSRPLAEQMKGRGCRPLRGIVDSRMTREERLAAIAASEKPACMIVDLVGVTGMADCASTAHILADGLPDEVVERANKNALKKADGPIDMGEELRKARKELTDEERERRRAEREAKEAAERAEAARRAKIKSEVTYSAIQVQQGSGVRMHHANGKRGPRMIFGKHKGKLLADMPSGYLRSMVEGEWCKTAWLRDCAQREIDKRRSGADRPASNARPSVDEINAMLAGSR